MAISFNSGVLKSSDITATTSDAGVGQRPDRRRIFNFGDRVAELVPEESPFFVYLNQVAKSPTDDPVFRYLENRNRISFTDRSFLLAADVNGGSAVSAGSSYSFTVDTSGGAAVEYLIKGMVFSVNTLDSTAGYSQVLVRVESGLTHASSSSSFTGKIIDISANIGSGYNILSDNDTAQIIGSSFEEGSGSPDVFSSELEDDFGYTQIFKTAAEMTNTAYATRYRGYAEEWNRIWATKLREHKIDIERAMLFGQRARVSGIQYTEGLVGHIVKNVSPVVNDSAFSYSSGNAYYRSVAQSELTYDRLLSDLEVIFDPARGGMSEKLVLCSLPVITFFNKLGSDAFLSASLAHNGAAALSGGATTVNQSPLRMNMESRQGSFGHNIMVIDTIHGTLNLVKEPLFRGISSGFMLMADMTQLAYRPLIGNGINRDTQVMTNVQGADEDLRKDMILTEAGLEVTLPESHALFNLEGV
tara:strand:+ start:1316 stop:2731 length:1416 start_codon:yes stop_codon:yes gene_type:complete